jgi:tetratricopeptide (TPR) repeat protein
MAVEAEFVKWMMLLVAAAALALVFAARMAGADAAPARLPADMDTWARPMENADAPFYPEVGPPLRTNELNQVLWRIIELHRQGQVEEAILGWEQANVPCETETWMHTAIAAANLQAGRIEEAQQHLDAALEVDPANAVAHYYVGLLRLTQAQGARNWPNAIGPMPILLIAMPNVTPNTRAMYELAAMQALEEAIELAPTVDPYAPLAPYLWATDDTQYLPLVTPTIGDLLTALGADRYPMRAHNLLGALYTDHGQLDQAEEHIDGAATGQMNAPYAYRDLGKAMEQEGRHEDAARVYLKAFRHGDANLIPAWKVFENGWKATRGD